MARSKALTRAEDITPVILVLRGSRVILDRDLAHDLRRHNQAPERAGEAQRRALSPGLHKRASAREFRVSLLSDSPPQRDCRSQVGIAVIKRTSHRPDGILRRNSTRVLSG